MLDLKFLKGILDKLTVKKPNFLVIEVIDHYLQITELRADLIDKNITVYKNWIKEIDKIESDYLLHVIKKVIKKIPKRSELEIILNLDSNLATTIYSSVSLVRPKPKEIIDEADLDNLISQAIWRFFDKQRPKTAKKMGIEEIDVVLSDVRIRGIKVDGHRVVNPLGFKARSVEIYLSETYAVRDFIKGVKEMMLDNKIIFISEAGATLSHMLFKNSKEKEPLILADLFSDQTVVFQASAGHLNYLDSFKWGGNSFVNSIKENFKIDHAVAHSMIDVYNKNGGSPHFTKKIENILMDECRVLANGIESLTSSEGTIYINPYFNPPSCFISDRFRSKFGKNYSVQLLSTDLVMKNFNFKLQFNKSANKLKNTATLLSVLSELSMMPKNEKISYLANRRVRWLLS
ncbi:MAG: hypothetical protein M1155_02730 [Patescibacteria group bacterium]|nr:hypothetical protein [Patescibacteria group bacterium]